MNLIKRLTGNELQKKADQIRKDVVEIAVGNEAGHIAPSLSCIDILTALYYGVIRLSDDPEWNERDRVILSKGHGCYGLYSILSDLGYIDRREWESFYRGSPLSGCVERSTGRGLEACCGSLGHGLPIATGIAFGAKLQNKKFSVYCIVGDGEMQEGSNWEAIQFAAKKNLKNLAVVIDNNRLQAMDQLESVMTIEGRRDDLKNKLEAFGFTVKRCDGHNTMDILATLDSWAENESINEAPRALIADTVKGFGLTCMENNPIFHFRVPTEEELQMGSRYE